MRELLLVGIGTGNPDHVTIEAQQALRRAVQILIPRKGPDKEDLAELRFEILTQARATGAVVEFEYPNRDPELPYVDRVHAWHDEIAQRWTEALAEAPPGPIALLVWGDPTLYDSTIRIAERLSPELNIRVIPGITAIQALSAAHALPLATIGGGYQVTTGRQLRAEGWPEGADTLVVMLDGDCAFQRLDGTDYDIWWGAYLGMNEQVLMAGRLADVAGEIVSKRAEAREKHGWIMDTYILRRR